MNKTTRKDIYLPGGHGHLSNPPVPAASSMYLGGSNSCLDGIIETTTKFKHKPSSKKKTAFSMKYATRIGTWNVRTLLEPTKLAQLCSEFRRYKLALLGVSECRWPDSGEFTTAEGYKFIFSGKTSGGRREGGVGFLMSKSVYSALIQWNAHSDRIISIRLRTRARYVTIVQCYAPTEVSDYSMKEEFYSCLSRTTANINKGDIVIVMGDFNAQLGSNNVGMENIMGRHGLGTMTENGQLFSELCSSDNLCIGGTIFPHKRVHKVTWISPDHRTENQIDHITISRKWRRPLLDVRNKRGAGIASGHHLFVAKICTFEIRCYSKK